MSGIQTHRADSDSYGDAGLTPADEGLPLITYVIELSIHDGVHEPWRRYLKVPEGDEDAFEEWKGWFRSFLRKRAES
ncbi:hypothetical protein [Candidatus Palauibacter irciniicola]|uniref:hypothetical protein n=1 Tax=Candidatus Palauibacter irciniicola TaxID=3056733 RepID=UPI003B02049E